MQMYELPVSPFAPVAGSRSADVTGVRAGRAFEGTDWVAEEVPVALEYNGALARRPPCWPAPPTWKTSRWASR